MKKFLLAACAAALALSASAQTSTPNSNDLITIQDQALLNHRVNAFTYMETAASGGGTGANASLAGANTFTAANTFSSTLNTANGDLQLLGSSTGYTILESGLSSTSNNTLTLPVTSTDTLAALGTSETWTGTQTFGTINLAGSNQLGGVVISNGTETPTATVGGTGSPTASLTNHAGSKVMEFTLASAGSATNIVVTPGYSAAHGWACFGYDATTSTERVIQNAALSATTATLTFFNAAGTATAPGATDIIVVDCDSF
jgi:hypothetical protein